MYSVIYQSISLLVRLLVVAVETGVGLAKPEVLMLRNHLKIALRNLRKNRLFSSLNIMGMGVGMAAVGLMGLYIANELSYDRFNTQADRIVRVVQHATWSGGDLQVAITSAPFAAALKKEYPDVEKAVRINPEGGGLITYRDKKVEANDIFFTDKTVFDVFTYPLLFGNPATALTQPQSIVLTKTLAEKLFGDAGEAVGQPVEFSNHVVNTVTGVMADVPLNSHLQFSALRSFPANYTEGWQNANLYTYLLLMKGSDPKTLEAKLPDFFTKYLKPEMGDVTYRMELQPLTAIHLHSHLDYEAGANGDVTTVSIFSVIAALVLLIAGINYVNLYTARSIARTREVGVRKAIGSRRGQLIGQFMTESLLMAFLAGAAGIILVNILLPWFNQLADRSLSITQFGVFPAVSITVLFTMLLGVGSGLYPALLLSGYRPVPALKGQMGRRTGKVNFRQALVVFQFVAAIALIACSAMIYRQMNYMQHKDLGFAKDQVLTFHLNNDESRRQVQAFKEELKKSPLIEAAAAATNPIGNNDIGSKGMFFEQNGVMADATQLVQKFAVDADYLNTLAIRLVKGRNFAESSPGDALGAVLVNEALVKKMGWREPIGKRINSYVSKDKLVEMRVIGVVADFHTYSLQHKIEPLVLQMPAPDDRDNLYVRIRPASAKDALAYIGQVYHNFDPAGEVNVHFLDENFSHQYKAEQKQGHILLTFTILAVLIACLGLFGLAAFAAEARKKEIGVRKVLGASVGSVVTLLSKDFLTLVGIAMLPGLPLAWYLTGLWLQNFAYHLDAEWWVFAGAGLLAVVVALLTVSVQSVKAALMNPVLSLKTE